MLTFLRVPERAHSALLTGLLVAYSGHSLALLSPLLLLLLLFLLVLFQSSEGLTKFGLRLPRFHIQVEE